MAVVQIQNQKHNLHEIVPRLFFLYKCSLPRASSMHCPRPDITKYVCMYIHTKTTDVDDDIVVSLPVLMKAPTVNAIRGKRKYGVISRNRLPLPYNASTSLFFV